MNETAGDSLGKFSKEINLDALYSALIQCFSVILCGYGAGRLNLISPREAKGLDVFVRTFSLPAVIFLSIAQLDMSQVNWNFLASILVSKTALFVGVVTLGFLIIRNSKLGTIALYAVFCTQGNDFALGFPILEALYGGNHPTYSSFIYLLAPISLAFLNPIAYVLLEIEKYQTEKSSEGQIENETTLDAGTSSSIQESSREDNAKAEKSGVRLCAMVFLSLITNPIMFMTILGILGNFIYGYISFVNVVLRGFASVFSTTALFVLGLRMVGTMHRLKGHALITPGVLIITKLLVAPLVTREIVSLLRPGVNASDTLDLSSLGFMYSSFPSAPSVFVLATQYDTQVETISSSLVVSTFLSAPLMYISAKMIFMDFLPVNDYCSKLESFQYNISLVGIPLGLWLIFTFTANKSFSKIPHRITGCLIVSQVLLCVGVVLRSFVNPEKPWFEYIQMTIVSLGLYSSRLWTFVLAMTLAIFQSRSLCFVIKLFPFFVAFAWGVPMVLMAAVSFVSYHHPPLDSVINPTFRNGIFQSVITLLLLTVSFLGTSVCLVLHHRYQLKFSKYLILVRDINSRDLNEVRETSTEEGNSSRSARKVADIEEIVTQKDNTCTGNCKHELCSSSFNCSESQREACEETIKQYTEETVNEDMDEDHQDLQILRHVVLALLLVTAMFVNLMLSIWTLVVDDAISGVYIEILFLNVMLNTGQICLTFVVFGFDSRGLIVALTNRWRKFFYGADTIVLPSLEELGFETTHVCHQFIAHHLKKCEEEIAKTKRLRLRAYKNCFKGRSLVSWLQSKHLAKNEAEAIQYAAHLLEGRVLRHVENRYHFENSDLLYTFRQ